MATYVALLRAINLGATRKVPMARLRELLVGDGFADVATYLQSGNVVLSSTDPAPKVAARLSDLIEGEFGFAVPTIVRTRSQLAKVVAADPIPGAADDPKRYQVTCFAETVSASTFADVGHEGWDDSRWAFRDGHLYTYTPAGIHADRMLRALGKAHRGVDATARNWSTMTKLLELAG